MTDQSVMPITRPLASPWRAWGLILFIALATIAVYVNTLSGPFIFDDIASIEENPYVRKLWPIWEAMNAPPGTCISSRPLVALSLAINYCVSEYAVWSYHLFSITVHMLSAVLLFGVVHRTIRLFYSTNFTSRSAELLAGTIALIYAVHPLPTDAINHLSYRTEVMMGFFYLSTIYCFVRILENAQNARWKWGCWLACASGMACKENMVSAPIFILLFDYTFSRLPLARILRQRWKLYLGLLLGYGVLAAAMMGGFRGKLVGFNLSDLSFRDYFLTQFQALTLYLELSLWPHPLILDYQGWPLAHSFRDVWLYSVGIVGLAVATLMCLSKRLWPGLCLTLFFFIHAPTSLIPNAGEVIAEHRMYLPLAGVISLVVLGGRQLLIKGFSQMPRLLERATALSALVVISVVVLLCIATIRRNHDYRSTIAIWDDTLAKNPNNWRALSNLANGYLDLNQPDQAMPYLEKSLALNPTNSRALNNKGRALIQKSLAAQAIPFFHRSLALEPDYVWAHNNLGTARIQTGRPDLAVEHLQKALGLRPQSAILHHNLASAYLQLARFTDALTELDTALQLNPQHALSYVLKSMAYVGLQKPSDALAALHRSLQLDPSSALACRQLGIVYEQLDRRDEAIEALNWAVELDPAMIEAYVGQGRIWAEQKDFSAASTAYRKALALRPDSSTLHNDLSRLSYLQGNYAQAVEFGQKAVQLDPALVDAQVNLGNALLMQQQFSTAERAYQQAMALQPNHADANNGLCYLYSVTKQHERAVAYGRRAVALTPDNAVFQRNLGLALLDSGNPAQARIHLEKAIRIDPQDHEASAYLQQARSQVDPTLLERHGMEKDVDH